MEVEEAVLSGNPKNEDDFYRFMAWKIGKLRQADGAYYDGWCSSSGFYNSIKLEDLYKKTIIDYESLCDLIRTEQPIKFIDKIIGYKSHGIGPVYAIALLFFISKGKYPIYDRFADTAIKAINNKTPRWPIRGESSNCGAYDYKTNYRSYVRDVNELYKKYYNSTDVDYLSNRELDRALWVYGHGFSE